MLPNHCKFGMLALWLWIVDFRATYVAGVSMLVCWVPAFVQRMDICLCTCFFCCLFFFVHVELLFILRWHHLSPVGPENHLGSENPLVLLQSWPQSKKDMVAETLTHHAYTCLAVKCIWIPLKVLSWSYEGKFSLIFHKQTNMTNRWYKNLSQL